MSKAIVNRVNPATVIAMVALFVALSGVSYAAAKIGTKQLKNGAVTAKKLKRNAVSTVKLRNGAVRATKIADNAVTGAKVAEATLGKVPSAGHADDADKATHADSATSAASAGTASDADQLGGIGAERFGSGIVGAAVNVPGAPANAPSASSGAPIGEGDFLMPVPVAITVKNLTVRVAGDVSRQFVVTVSGSGGEKLACAGVALCSTGKEIALQPGELMELSAVALPGPAVFGGAKYQVGYQIVP